MTLVRTSGCLAAALLLASPAAAQSLNPGGFVCGLVNFSFCDQPSPPPPAPEVMPRPMPDHAADQRKHRRKDRTPVPAGER